VRLYSRENLRIPFAAAGPRGLEVQLIRPADGRTYPLALLTHGAPRDASDRPKMAPGAYHTQAIEFARRGFAVLIVMRRGFGDSGTTYAEQAAGCTRAAYLHRATASAQDLRVAITFMQKRADVTTNGMIAMGQSAGGLAAIALAADSPPGLAAVFNFAGGRGAYADNKVCNPDALVAAFAQLGRTARVPMLWVYSENDLSFGPEIAKRLHTAFQASGGRAKFAAAPAFARDGHFLFSSDGASIWTPLVDTFLREQNLGLRTPLPPPASDGLPLPPRLSDKGRESFKRYLLEGDQRAFAVSPRGAYG
jgi:dienelactone hydrolase